MKIFIILSAALALLSLWTAGAYALRGDRPRAVCSLLVAALCAAAVELMRALP